MTLFNNSLNFLNHKKKMGQAVSYLLIDQQYTPETSLAYYKFD
jgi:hypothetical protein